MKLEFIQVIVLDSKGFIRMTTELLPKKEEEKFFGLIEAFIDDPKVVDIIIKKRYE